MSFGAALVAIVLILAVSVLLMQYAENRKDRRVGDGEARHDRLEKERDEARQEIAELRDRVKVLERIATDPARRTADEIEKLRDE